MAIDEQRRHEMYLAFEDLVGPEVAATMMEHLPPVGWADVATKHDVEREINGLRNEMSAGFAEVREQIADTNRRTVMWLSSVMFTGLAAVFTAIVTTR